MKKIVFLVLMFGIAQSAYAAEVKLLCSKGKEGGGKEFVITFDPVAMTIDGKKAYKDRLSGGRLVNHVITDNEIQIYYEDSTFIAINRFTGSAVLDDSSALRDEYIKKFGRCSKAQQAF